jgi:hypothetical protein
MKWTTTVKMLNRRLVSWAPPCAEVRLHSAPTISTHPELPPETQLNVLGYLELVRHVLTVERLAAPFFAILSETGSSPIDLMRPAGNRRDPGELQAAGGRA